MSLLRRLFARPADRAGKGRDDRPAPDSLLELRSRRRGRRSMGGPRAGDRAGLVLPRLASPQVLAAAALVLLGVLGVLGLRWSLHWVVSRPMFTIREVRVLGDLEQVDRALVAKRALALQGGFFSLDLAQASSELRTVTWVRNVALRRIWPDGLEVTVEEQHPVARWDEGELVNQQGERFGAEFAGVLPYLSGPAGHEAQMVAEYEQFRSQLAPLGLAISDLELTERGAWRLTADNGLEVELGRDDVHGRLARFVQAYPQLQRVARPAGAVADLRYAHGFALRAGAGSRNPDS